MNADVAEANVNRLWTLAGTSIAIFTFLLFFLYPRYSSGSIDPYLFQIALTIIGFAIFSFVFSALYFYSITLAPPIGTLKLASYRQRAETLFVVGSAFYCWTLASSYSQLDFN